VTGSIEPGLRADIIVLRADRPNVWPINDAIGAVVWGMDTSNLDHVIVGGRRLLDAGALVADVEDARVRASRARERVVAAAGLTPAGASA
jgi:5-methylthioadenosine/S-adenosylhomocysteine deaminase